ncbi:MAG TPA: BatD family protein [Aggregicoccus sp.]|nr:BatD family protein [Aggregicoccus sp.]
MSRLLLLLPLLLAAPGHAQAPAAPPSVEPRDLRLSTEPSQVLLGEPFSYELVVTHPPAQRWELALPRELGAFELLEQQRQRVDAAQGGGDSVTTFRLKLAAFELGRLTLPPFSFEVMEAGRPGRFTPEPGTVQVASTLGDDAQAKGAQLEDLKPPTEVAVRSWRLVWGLLGALALGLAAWALLRYLRQRRAALPPPAPPLPLQVRTHQALQALQAERLPEQGRGREFYFRLSEILRSYLGERYAFEALECTSSELLLALRPRAADAALPWPELERFVAESDLVKYAKSEPPASACEASLAFAHALVDRTAALPTPDAAGPHVP